MKPSRNILIVEVPHDSLYDESGVVCYQYGNMGEVTQETRIYALPFLSSALALSTQFTYDSWGRILNITYPDNEVVNYAYDLGGQLQSITNNSSYTYLDNVTYDRFGAKVSQTYGNGLVTNYSYNNLTRRLSTITTLNGNSQISTFAYTYDPVGNVTQVASSCPWLNSQSFVETFTYDASDQLVSASETQAQSYQLAVTYGNWGKISGYSLAQTDLQNNTTQSETQAYTYPATNSIGNSQTLFAPEQRTITDANNNVSTETLTFGINGSLRKREVQGVVPHTEHYLFNSQANLIAYSNNLTEFSYYGYNAANTRTYKLSMLNTSQWVNGVPQSIQLNLQQSMFYPNAYINFNQNGEYTKHYYNGTERIASRLGDNQQTIEAEANDRLLSRIAQTDEIFKAQIGEMAAYEEPAVNVPARGNGEGTRNLLFPTVGYDPIPAFTDLQPTGNATDIFYYHTNHLGSTAFVTDQNQTVTQGFLYAPFGEITTEFNATFGNDIIPKYSFNAKELDEETGMYYYEARYYKPPVFTSRDAMFEKYFWMTPYAYCANNPVKYVDPDGKKVVINGDEQDAAFDEFKKGAARYGIKVKMNKHGVIRGRRYFGKSLTPEGKQILHAIRDKRINVKINATSSNTTEGGKPFFGGAFLGNTLSLVKNNKDGVAKYRVNTKQDVNPSDLKALSDYYGMPGQDMLHEVTESYEGGLLALEKKESIKNSITDKSSYQIVHQRAISQSGSFNQENKYHPDNKELQIGFIWSIGLYSKVWVLPQYKSLITNP